MHKKGTTYNVLLLTISGILWSHTVRSQGQSPVTFTVRSRVVDSQTKRGVPYASILDKNRVAGVYTDSLGVFSIPVFQNDTLVISAIGFYPIIMVANDTLRKQPKIPELQLKEHVYEFGMIDINSLGTYQQFKTKVLTLQLPGNTTQSVVESIQRDLKMIPRHPLQTRASIPLGGPISFVYNLVSKEGKERRHYNKVLKEEQEENMDEKSLALIKTKYNRNIVSNATGLTGDLLKRFMQYCHPDNHFLVISNDYQIYKQILSCFSSFKQEFIDSKSTITHGLR